jgi:peptidoglycan hydrolase-like protein with peptidoglycan-binding domain
MQVIQGGLHRPAKKRNTVRLALAISALALAFPATAFGAQSGSGDNSTRAAGRSSGEPGLGRTVLAFGSGYRSPSGSPLVRSLQRHLALAGYSAGATDGLFGPQTRRAVYAFQTSHGLRVDGIVGPQTWAALNSPALILGPGAGDQPGGSNLVRSLQRRLASAGDSPGPIDGRYGVITEDAVRRFQRAHGLQVTGMADPRAFAFLSTLARSNHRSNALPAKPASSVPPPSIGSRAPRNTPSRRP